MKVFTMTLLLFTAIANGQLKMEKDLYDLIHYFVEFADVRKYFQLPSIAHHICPGTTELIATLQTIVEKNNTDINTKTLGKVFHGAVERLMEGLKKHGADFGNKRAFVGRFQFKNDSLGLNKMPERAKKIFERFLELKTTLRQFPYDSDVLINKTITNKIRGQCTKLSVADDEIFDLDFKAEVTPFLHKLSSEHYQTPERPYWATFALYLSLIRCMMTDLLESSVNICGEFAKKKSLSRVKRDSKSIRDSKAPWMAGIEETKGGSGCSSRWGKGLLEKADGMLQESAKSEEQCKKTCESDPKCIAVDFDSGSKKCYLHVDVNVLKKTLKNQDYTQYEILVRPSEICIRTYAVISKKVSSEKGDLKKVSTLMQCKELCDYQGASCVAFHFNKTDKKCYLVTNKKSTTETKDENYDMYIAASNCDAGHFVNSTSTITMITHSFPQIYMMYVCEQPFKLTPGQISDSKHKREQSLDSCKKECLEDHDCLSFDYNFKTNICIIHRDTPTKSKEDTYAIHYEVTVPKLETCKLYLRLLNGAASLKGKTAANIKLLDECIISCKDTEGCVGVSFLSTKEQCNHHTDLRDFETYQFYGLGAMQLEVKTNCKGCIPLFITKEGHASPNGILKKELDQASKCKADCVTNNKCLAVDFNKKTKECRVHESEADLKKTLGHSEASHLSRHYLIYRCPG